MKQDIPRLEAYLRKVFGVRALTVKAADAKDTAEVAVGPRRLGTIIADHEDGETTYHFQWSIKESPQPFSPQELVRVQTFLREVLGTKNLSVRARGRLKDSAEVFVGDESMAIISADRDSYQFQMAILDIDLEDV
jgi:hypothetical protein